MLPSGCRHRYKPSDVRMNEPFASRPLRRWKLCTRHPWQQFLGKHLTQTMRSCRLAGLLTAPCRLTELFQSFCYSPIVVLIFPRPRALVAGIGKGRAGPVCVSPAGLHAVSRALPRGSFFFTPAVLDRPRLVLLGAFSRLLSRMDDPWTAPVLPIDTG